MLLGNEASLAPGLGGRRAGKLGRPSCCVVTVSPLLIVLKEIY